MPSQVLTVDDDPAQRELLREILEANGYSVEAAATGKAAIEKLSVTDYAVILLDLGLPEGRGELVVQWVLANRPHLKARIILMSGDPLSPARDVLVSKLRMRFLAKPYGIREVLEAVHSAQMNPTNVS